MRLNVVFSEFSDENHVRNLVRHVKRENAKFKNRDVISRVYVQMATRFNYESLVHVILEMVGLEPEEALYNELMTVYDDITDIQFDMMFCGLNMGEVENGSRMYPTIHIIYDVPEEQQKAFFTEIREAIGDGIDDND